MSLTWKEKTPRRVFISGGGSGIGREFAHRLAQEGADVAIFNRKLAPDVLAELKQMAIRPNQRFESYRADVSDEAGLRVAIDQAVAHIGAPDLAINSAGIQFASPFEKLSSDDFNHVIQVNLIGSRNFAAAVVPHLSQGAHLVFVASLAGLVGSFSYAAYCSSKYGVVGLAAALRVELKLQGIDVSICCPGEIDTPMVAIERATIHPIAAALKDFAGTMSVEPACELMLRSIARRKFEIVPGFKPRLTASLSRYLPNLMRLIADNIAAKALRNTKNL